MPKLQMLLYNVWGLPGCLSDGNASSRMRRISPKLADFDVVVLNEAFTSKQELLRDAPQRYVLGLGRQWFTLFDSGVVVLSKYPVVRWATEHYERRAGWDLLAAKGMVYCRLQVAPGPGGAIDVVATHMQAGNRPWEQAARRRQAAQLVTFLNRHTDAGAGAPLVLGGDLNMGPVADPLYRRFSGHYGSQNDARRRHAAYKVLCSGCSALREASSIANGPEDDICRFLTAGLNVRCDVAYLDHFEGLSDTAAIAANVTWPEPALAASEIELALAT